MLTENETVVIDLYGQFQRRLKNVNQEFTPLATGWDDYEEAFAPVELSPEPAPEPAVEPSVEAVPELPGPRVAKIGGVCCPLPPRVGKSGRK